MGWDDDKTEGTTGDRGGAGGAADADSFRRNSTHIRENDSVSSGFSRSRFGLIGPEPEETRRPLNEGRLADKPERCSPAFSRSLSSHDRMDDKRESISKRFGSEREVVRNWRRMFVTSRRSTLLSDEFFRNRRRASVRCSLIITAFEGG